MKKNELLELIKDIAEDGDVMDLLMQQEDIKSLAKPLDLNSIGVEQFKELLASNPTVQAYNQSTMDSSVSKGVESFKAKKLPLEIQKAVEEALKAKNNEGKEPWQIEMEQLKADIAAKDKKIAQDNLAIKFSSVIAKENLSPFQKHILNGETEEEIQANIDYFKNSLGVFVNAGVEAKVKGGSYVPPVNGGQGTTITKDQFKTMGYREKVKIFDENPDLYNELNK